ncbi:unnamed protein product [Larinioides sclopetarius]|uniref:Uncharacterized protein n=1 Tax=Larinioides sclopetarius TaxID=280406 RepID=A0AAV2AX47_9ARAC
MEVFTIALFFLSQFSMMCAFNVNDEIPGIPGVPDDRKMKVRISRGSGMGMIHPGYILLVLLAFAAFVGIAWLIAVYKKEKDKNDKRVLFLNSY